MCMCPPRLFFSPNTSIGSAAWILIMWYFLIIYSNKWLDSFIYIGSAFKSPLDLIACVALKPTFY